MQVLREPEAYRRACDEARGRGLRVGLVPTMGALHAGHVALIEEVHRRASFVVVSIFVNPTQFGPNEDFTRYPRMLEADLQRCEHAGVAAVFAPAREAMYPPGEETRVRVGATAAGLCGAHRPGHFEGVATIVAKLFAIAGGCVAVFGKKDYQQLCVLRRMVQDLCLPVELIGVPTVREPDGLAMSSRNAYLSPEQRAAAQVIPRALSHAWDAFQQGERDPARLIRMTRAAIAEVVTSIDYVEVADPETAQVLRPGESAGERALLATAVRIGNTRLIDNVVLGEDSPPMPALAGVR